MNTRILSLTLFTFALATSNSFSQDAPSEIPATLTLEEAVRADDVGAVSASLAAGEDPDSLTPGGAPVLVLAAAMNLSSIVDVLLENGASVNAAAPGGATALMYASGSNNGALAKHLLDAGADIDMRDEQGDPAVNWGSYYGSLQYVQVLLDHNPDTSLRGHGNAFEIALRRGHEETLEAIAVFNGTVSDPPKAGLDRFGRPMLHRAARLDDVSAVNALLEDGVSADVVDEIGYTALMHAARDGALASVKILVTSGADVNHKGNDYGLALTPLHLAAIGNDVEAASYLIDKGANIDVQGVTDQTPLSWALIEGSRESALILLKAGADWQIGPDGGPDLRELAERMGWSEIVELMSR